MTKYVVEHIKYLTKSSRYKGIDLLRAVAIIGVVFFHLGDPLNINPFQINRFGWMGVDLFFVLSGFLIGGIIINEIMQRNDMDFKLFYKKRFLRIYPLYLFIIFATIIGNTFVVKATEWNPTQFINQLGSNMLFLQTFIQFNTFYIPGGTWSLVVEEFFYLFAPILLLLIMKLTNRNLTYTFWILFVIYISGTVTRLIVIPDDVNLYFSYMVKPFSRYDEIVAGILVYIIVRKQWFKQYWNKMLYVGLLLCIAIFIYVRGNHIILLEPHRMTAEVFYYPLILSFTFGCILLALYNLKFNNIIINIVARLSYCIYLIHFVLETYFKDFRDFNPILLHLLILISSYAVSLLIEYPFIRNYRNESTNKPHK